VQLQHGTIINVCAVIGQKLRLLGLAKESLDAPPLVLLGGRTNMERKLAAMSLCLCRFVRTSSPVVRSNGVLKSYGRWWLDQISFAQKWPCFVLVNRPSDTAWTTEALV